MSNVMMYELLDVPKERAEELAQQVEHILFFSEANFDKAILEIIKLADSKEEAFLLGNLYRYYYDAVKDNLTKVITDEKADESDN